MASPLLYILYGATVISALVSVIGAFLAIRSARSCQAIARAEQERARMRALLA